MNEQTTTALATTTAKAPVAIGRGGIQITDMDGLVRFANAVAKSGLAPKGIQTPEAICIALEMGLEVGLPPMAALQNIAVINGRPSIWGDAMLAVCRATGEVAEFSEWYEDGGKRLPRNPVTFSDTTVAVCRVTRTGYEPAETGFSVADAKTAKLWGKEGPWSQYPARMLRFRARSFALRDSFGDALKGLRSAEEVSDDPVENAKPATEAAPEFKPRKKREQSEPTPTAPQATPPEVIVSPEDQERKEPAQEPIATDPAPSTGAIALTKDQEQFAEFCEDANVAFDKLVEWLKASNRLSKAYDPEGFHDIPDYVIAELRKSRPDIAKMVKECGKLQK